MDEWTINIDQRMAEWIQRSLYELLELRKRRVTFDTEVGRYTLCWLGDKIQLIYRPK